MYRALRTVLLASLLAGTFAGCLGGDRSTCVPVHEDVEEPMELVTKPDLHESGEGWRILVQCNEGAASLDRYRFEFLPPEGHIIEIRANGTWESPLTTYAPTRNTTEGDRIQAQSENPGNEGDPTYRIQFFDEDEDRLLGAHDEIHITYDAGAQGIDEFDSPLESGQYQIEVFKDDRLVAQHFERFIGPPGG